MGTKGWPIAVTVNGGAAAGVRLWRQRGQLYATVVVKATFSLVPGKVMVLGEPQPVEPDERPAAPGTGIATPGDLAPCLVQPEVWVRGHANTPPARGATSIRVRLALARDATLLISKTVDIPVTPGSFVPPFLPAFAPLAGEWPVRARLLRGLDPAALRLSPTPLPDSFDWSYFQAAPSDQRVGPLRGDEWLRLEGFFQTMPRLDTRLPSARAAATLFGRSGPLQNGAPIRVGLDSIEVDADLGTCALVFRGYMALPAGSALDEMQIVCGVGLPEQALSLPNAPTPSRFPSSVPPSAPDPVATLILDAETGPRVIAAPAIPFSRSVTLPPPEDAPDLRSALPFQAPRPAPPPEPAVVEPPRITEGELTLGAHFLAAMQSVDLH